MREATERWTDENERVGRGCLAMQRAVAEWMLLASAVDLLIRARKSSFSGEAAHMHNMPCIEIG